MKSFSQQYQIAKQNAVNFMEKGQIAAYLEALLEMNKYKKLMVATVSN